MNFNPRNPIPLEAKEAESKRKMDVAKEKIALERAVIDKMSDEQVAVIIAVRYISIAIVCIIASICVCSLGETMSIHMTKYDIKLEVHNLKKEVKKLKTTSDDTYLRVIELEKVKKDDNNK